jgi:ADP-ribosyl-[dinitrogen reductase] hydrolase
MDLYRHILGCILGTAVGDAAGLRREGLSARRAEKLYGSTVSPNLLFGRGYCSDDTEHTLMVGHSLCTSGAQYTFFEEHLARNFKRWLLTIPPGIGFGTLKACLKLLLGFGPERSGVGSAGNGPAMRSALIGLCSPTDEAVLQLVRASTSLTHIAPRAAEGAWVVARAARLPLAARPIEPIQFLSETVGEINGRELREVLAAATRALSSAHTPREFAQSLGWKNRVTGYVNQTVPAALYCWAHSPNDFAQCIQNAVSLGGDTDTVAAITGAIAGANLTDKAIPHEWLARLAEWPRTTAWMQQLAERLSEAAATRMAVQPPSMRWLATVPRNLVFGAVVIVLALRRLLPPY